MTPPLEIRDVRKALGGVQVLAGCSFTLERAGIFGLIGPNGAGKTTLFDVVTGRQQPDRGAILLNGRAMTGRAPHRLTRLGVGRTFQECRVFPEMTCLDNVLFATQPKNLGASLGQALTRSRRRRDADSAEARRLLRLATLDRLENEPAGNLSYGQRRLLEIVSALVMRPHLLLLDEPASGVNPALLAVLRELLLTIQRERPTVFLIVEHNMEFIMGLSERIIVMHQGAVLEEGPPESIQISPRVLEAYLG
jgi:branched-chain amino acid transport system ATP-binding protein